MDSQVVMLTLDILLIVKMSFLGLSPSCKSMIFFVYICRLGHCCVRPQDAWTTKCPRCIKARHLWDSLTGAAVFVSEKKTHEAEHHGIHSHSQKLQQLVRRPGPKRKNSSSVRPCWGPQKVGQQLQESHRHLNLQLQAFFRCKSFCGSKKCLVFCWGGIF